MPIQITANRYQDEPWRLERLKKVAAAVEHATNFSKVIALHDHKGWLYVNFDQQPSMSDVLAVAKAWSEENEDQMNIYVRNEPLIWDIGGANPFGGRET
jgi:hypothetical protein